MITDIDIENTEALADSKPDICLFLLVIRAILSAKVGVFVM